jgi:hypothetical protein
VALKKADIKPPVLPREAVEVVELGGEVVVRGLLLRERLALFDDAREDGARFGHLSAVLAACVVDADGKPVYTADEWEQFGATHFEAALKLFAAAQRLSGLDVEGAKKN